jgi:hypothetical protein
MRRGLIIGSIVAGFGLIGFGIYRYFKKQIDLATNFEWKILDINFKNVSINNLTGKIKFRFENKSDIEIMINEFYLDLYLSGEYIGWLRDSGEFVIPAKGFNDLEFDFTINPTYIISNALDIISIATKNKDAMFTLKGYMKVKSGLIRTTIELNCDCSTKNVDCDCKF